MLSILRILLVGVSTVFLLCGAVLWMRRHDGDRSRSFLAYTWMLFGLIFLTRLIMGWVGIPVAERALPVANIMGGLLVVMFLYLYPLEIINSAWLSRKRAILFFLPGVLLVLSLWFIQPFARELFSFADIWIYIGEFNVWYRLLVLLFGLSLYSVLLYFIPYNWMKSTIYHSWIVLYTLKIQVIAALFVVFMLTGSALVSSIHLLVWIVVGVTTTYRELFIRFEMPHEATLSPAEPPVTEVLAEQVDDTDEEAPLVHQLSRLMEDEEVWRNPDLDLPDLAQLLHTNRSYLSKTIQHCGYKNFSDLVNRKRIAEFLKLADAGRVASVQDTFFYVGFRSRETALRCFKKYVGMSPTDYLRRQMSSEGVEAE